MMDVVRAYNIYISKDTFTWNFLKGLIPKTHWIFAKRDIQITPSALVFL